MNDANAQKKSSQTRNISRVVRVTVFAVALLATAGTLYAWSAPPSATPPTCPSGSAGGGCDAPINVSNTLQSKDGNLLLNAAGSFATGLSVPFGNVGIGTTSPINKLTIVSAVVNDTLWLDSATNNAALNINNSSVGGRRYGVLSSGGAATVPSSFRVYDFTAGVDRLVISPLGNMGIGSTSPAQKLEVAGNINIATGNCFMVNGTCVAGGGGSSVAGPGGPGGTLNYVTKWTPNGTTIGNSQIFANGTNVGIGTGGPA